MSAKDCAYPGCERAVLHHRLMCGPHWNRVPYALQRAVNATQDARLLAMGTPGYGEATKAHEAAKHDAIVAAQDAVLGPRLIDQEAFLALAEEPEGTR